MTSKEVDALKTKPTILVLDDQEAYLSAVARALRSNFEVVGAQTVDEARQAVDQDLAAALVDIRLREDEPSNREGLRFLTFLRSQSSVPAIAMSALDDDDLPSRAREAGAIEFLSKPIRVSRLRSVLKEVIKRRR